MSYLCDLFFIFIFIFIIINDFVSLKQTHLLFCTFLEYVLLLLDDNVDEEIFFKFQKFSLRVLLTFCLIFRQFQPGVAYKSVAYKKSMYIRSSCKTENALAIVLIVLIVRIK